MAQKVAYALPMGTDTSAQAGSLLDLVEMLRADATRKLDPDRRIELGQFFTPVSIARFMASMLRNEGHSLHLLDAGAGIGSLTAAWIANLCESRKRPEHVKVTAFEIEPSFAEYLRSTLEFCQKTCKLAGIQMDWEICSSDFIEFAASRTSLFSKTEFTTAIINPPYRKMRSDSRMRDLLRNAGIETGNLYSAFLALAVGLLRENGELVAISPRSFCNGPYFREFRRWWLGRVRIRRLHVFEARDTAFRDDDVLQENVIMSVIKDASGKDSRVIVSSSYRPEDEILARECDHSEVVSDGDPDAFIHVVPDQFGEKIGNLMGLFRATLSDLGLEVSTGRVVDFRATQFLRESPTRETVPLIYPSHLRKGFVEWPLASSRKPQAILGSKATRELLVPRGWYVLVKRFSAKEERRRIVAAVCDPSSLRSLQIGFENHLNYFHCHGEGLSEGVAKGLSVFLNSQLVDLFFRQFSGHTQVNAEDLRRLRYPNAQILERLGTEIGDKIGDQIAVDQLIDEIIDDITSADEEMMQIAFEGGMDNPLRAKRKLDDALTILRSFGLPKSQQNERSALTLLAVLDLTPEKEWSEASDPLVGITPIMDFIAEHYGKQYKPNTRESVRRFTIHQFLEAGLMIANPDRIDRPINSPKAVYQIGARALALIRSFATPAFEKNLREYLASVETLTQRYAREREMEKIPIVIAEGKTISLSPGGQNILVKKIIDDFCPRFTPGALAVYVGDTNKKWFHFEEKVAQELGLNLDPHGKMPDVVVFFKAKNWLVLIEAVTSHGPVNPKRRGELEQVFQGCNAGLVYVTAFLDRPSMTRYLNEISWETEVWVAEAPTHLIHFNGERFLGPY
jgi:adenine-specific DNA-methyltransferase